MSTTITTGWDRRVVVRPGTGTDDRLLAIARTDGAGDEIRAHLTGDEARQIAGALAAEQGGQWTRDDLPDPPAITQVVAKAVASGTTQMPSAAVLDAVVAHLNAHHPKSEGESRWKTATNRVLLKALADAERERCAAVARADELARLLRETGEVEQIRPAGTVTRSEVEQAVRSRGFMRRFVDDSEVVEVDGAVNGVWELLECVDRAAHVVREAEVAAIKVERMPRPDGTYRWDTCNGTGTSVPDDAEAADNAQMMVELRAKGLVSALAVQRAIEVEQAVDPVEAKVRELAELLGDFALADEHTGQRNDMQLARLLVTRGVTVAREASSDA